MHSAFSPRLYHSILYCVHTVFAHVCSCVYNSSIHFLHIAAVKHGSAKHTVGLALREMISNIFRSPSLCAGYYATSHGRPVLGFAI